MPTAVPRHALRAETVLQRTEAALNTHHSLIAVFPLSKDTDYNVWTLCKYCIYSVYNWSVSQHYTLQLHLYLFVLLHLYILHFICWVTEISFRPSPA